MKSIPGLLLLVVFGAAFAHAQASPTHVIVIVQENRTPDNLFGADYGTLTQKGANLWNPANPAPCVVTPTTLAPSELDACFDPQHGHEKAWIPTYDAGKMDGACGVPVSNASCSSLTYANYSYVENTSGKVTPYFNIAANYGFANYMFQTNQGPSFPAHQFLFGGTSAPDFYNDPNGQNCTYSQNSSYPCWQLFASENPTVRGQPAPMGDTGCAETTEGDIIVDINPDAVEGAVYNAGFPCYTHYTMSDILTPNGITWTYYTPADSNGLWTAPNAISAICSNPSGGKCGGMVWQAHVKSPTSGHPAPILDDIAACNLPTVSWVTPDGQWSDHPGTMGQYGGPSWVAAIVNAIGNYSNPEPGCGYWNNTVILITWDDWGGWFDHVTPPIGYQDSAPQDNGQEYVYGFRVPLLVVSAYAKPGYISGSQGMGTPYIHDFGSILGYIEHVTGVGEISPNYHYADYYAPDGAHVCGLETCPYPLADFFGSTFNPFTPILGAIYQPSCFSDPGVQSNCFGSNYHTSPPDNDGVDLQD